MRVQRLICRSKEFEIRKATLITLDLFARDPELLCDSCTVTSDVSLDVFQTFVDAIMGKSVDVTLDNYAKLDLLCRELGFHGLDHDICNI